MRLLQNTEWAEEQSAQLVELVRLVSSPSLVPLVLSHWMSSTLVPRVRSAVELSHLELAFAPLPLLVYPLLALDFEPCPSPCHLCLSKLALACSLSSLACVIVVKAVAHASQCRMCPLGRSSRVMIECRRSQFRKLLLRPQGSIRRIDLRLLRSPPPSSRKRTRQF